MNVTGTLQSTSRAREYLDLWAKFISEQLSGHLHADVRAEALSDDASMAIAGDKGEPGTWIHLTADRAGEQAFFLGGQDARQLLQFLGSSLASQDATTSPDARNALEEFFRQVARKIPIEEWLGVEAEVRVSESDAAAWESPVQAAYRFSVPRNPSLVIHAQIGADLAAAFQSAQESGAAEREARPAIGTGPANHSSEPARDIRLELLMDVELEVVLRFGQREMLLREILNMAPGTVLELDQQIHDPVELLVGNKVIAWGEVVTVDGNYGFRITSLASRKERLESLRK